MEEAEWVVPSLAAHTLVVFDWDDTILPTTILRERSKAACGRQGGALTPSWGAWPAAEVDEEIGIQFEALAELAKVTLEVAAKCGKVCMITNGSSDWIRTSCLRYMPSLWPSVEPIRRISAKDLVQAVSRDPLQWKKQTFAQIFTEHFAASGPVESKLPKVVISIGDSLHERHALYNFYHTTNFENVAIRSVKFVPLPGLAALKAQHSALAIHLPSVAALPMSCRSADLRYRFQTLNGDEDLESPNCPSAASLLEEEEEDLSHVAAPVSPVTDCVPLPLCEDPLQIVQVVWKACEMNRLAEAEVREKVRQMTDEDSESGSDTSPLSDSGDCARRNAESATVKGGVGSFLRGAGISLSKMLGRGFTTPSTGEMSKDGHDGDTTRATTSGSSFALTPTAAPSLPVLRAVKLNQGNPYLLAFTHGFVFDPPPIDLYTDTEFPTSIPSPTFPSATPSPLAT